MISIVIPAYNEEAVIGRCLSALTATAAPGEFEIIVACNGCRDHTAARAREFGPLVRVVETPQASKIAALNLGDRAATAFPRCFIDADVVVSADAVRQVAQALQTGAVHVAAPALHVDVSRSSWAVRAFYAIWLKTPYHQAGTIGSGFFALSQTGRARFEAFPPIIADDAFVRALFRPAERATLRDCHFTIQAPRTLPDLIKIKTRSRLGLYELAARFPQLPGHGHPTRHSSSAWLRSPASWPAAAVYLYVNVVTRLRARRQKASLQTYQWERDESSRTIETSSTAPGPSVTSPL